MFCSSCGALGYIQPNGALECKRCDHVDQKVTTITPNSEIGVESLLTSTGEPEKRCYEVIEKIKLPTTNAYYCPEGGCNELVKLRQSFAKWIKPMSQRLLSWNAKFVDTGGEKDDFERYDRINRLHCRRPRIDCMDPTNRSRVVER